MPSEWHWVSKATCMALVQLYLWLIVWYGSEFHKLYEFVPLSKQNYYIILGHKYSMGSIRLNICRPRENPELCMIKYYSQHR